MRPIIDLRFLAVADMWCGKNHSYILFAIRPQYVRITLFRIEREQIKFVLWCPLKS